MAELRTEDVQLMLNDNESPQGKEAKHLDHSPTIPVYDPYKVPADIDLAKKHGKAKKVYVSKLEDKYEEVGREVCVCCGLPVEGEQIPLRAGLEKLYHLGSGLALYFRFIKYSAGLLIMLFLANSLYNIVSNVTQGDCSSEVVAGSDDCVKGYILSFTIANKKENEGLLSAQLILNFVAMLLIMLFFHFLRYQFRKTEIEADDKTITPSDYTIVIEDMPPSATKDEIEEWIHDFATEDHPLSIERITRPHDIHTYVQISNKRSALIKARDSLKKKDGTYPTKDLVKAQVYDEQIKEIQAQIEGFKKGGLAKCSLVYVTFTKAQQSAYFQSKFKRSILADFFRFFLSKVVTTSNQFQGTTVHVKRAPEPSDIMWENLGYSKKERMTNRLYTTLITGVLIALGFGIIIAINYGQKQTSKSLGKDSPVVQILSIAASLVIVITNTLLSMTIDYLARYEKHFTYTYYLKGVAEKLAVAQFFNTALTN